MSGHVWTRNSGFLECVRGKAGFYCVMTRKWIHESIVQPVGSLALDR